MQIKASIIPLTDEYRLQLADNAASFECTQVVFSTRIDPSYDVPYICQSVWDIQQHTADGWKSLEIKDLTERLYALLHPILVGVHMSTCRQIEGVNDSTFIPQYVHMPVTAHRKFQLDFDKNLTEDEA